MMMNWTCSATIAAVACSICNIGCSSEQSASGSSTQGTSSNSVTGTSSVTGTGVGGTGGAGASGTSASGTSASASGTGAGGADAGGIDCSPITNIATEIEETYLNQVQPTAIGGTILDGTYELTSRAIYTGPTGMTGKSGAKYRETIHLQTVSPGMLSLRAAVSINGATEQHLVFKASVNGSHLDASPMCGGTFSLSMEFDATPTELKTYVVMNGAPLLVIFTKK